MAGASLTTLAHFEVLLRNAVDNCLATEAPETPVEETWLLDPATLSPQGMRRVREVLGRLEREGYPRERRDVLPLAEGARRHRRSGGLPGRALP